MNNLIPFTNALQNTEKYGAMHTRIESRLPALVQATEAFNKSASQFKTVTLDVVDLTPISTARHILASVTRTRQALVEATVGVQRKAVDIAEKEQELGTAKGFHADRLRIGIAELRGQITDTEAYGRGALRKLSFLVAQYDTILERLGVDEITEEMYEDDQRRYHVMTAFAQGLHSARARGGTIDEGNLIYLFQIGINGGVAQRQVTELLMAEEALFAEGKAPTHEYTLSWLEGCADAYADDSIRYAELRGLLPRDNTSLVTEG